MSIKEKYRDQDGFAMILEIILFVIVLSILGFVVYRVVNHQSVVPTAASPAAPSTVANGSVDNAVNALTQDVSTDDSSAGQEDATVPATDTSSNTAQGVEGSFDDNSF